MCPQLSEVDSYVLMINILWWYYIGLLMFVESPLNFHHFNEIIFNQRFAEINWTCERHHNAQDTINSKIQINIVINITHQNYHNTFFNKRIELYLLLKLLQGHRLRLLTCTFFSKFVGTPTYYYAKNLSICVPSSVRLIRTYWW